MWGGGGEQGGIGKVEVECERVGMSVCGEGYIGCGRRRRCERGGYVGVGAVEVQHIMM